MNERVRDGLAGRTGLAGIIVLAAIATSVPAGAGPRGVAHVPLPVDLSGTLQGANYRIRVPADWNGTLLVFAHGTRTSAVPTTTVEIAPPGYPVPDPSFEEQLLALGYALAGSEFESSDKDGIQRTLALTNYFRGAVGSPGRIIAWGNSLGGNVTAGLIERYPGVFDAGIANCAPIGGRARNMDGTLPFALAYDVTFGWLTDRWGPIEDVRDGITLIGDVIPYVQWPSESNIGAWEFIRLVTKVPPEAFWATDGQTQAPFFALQMWRATEARSGQEALAGGPVAQNLDQVYTLTDAEKAYLAMLGVDAEPLVAQMNARTKIEARRSARLYLDHWFTADGVLRRPMLTMHSIYDGLASIWNEGEYRARVDAAGSGDLLVQTFVGQPAHCSFTPAQHLATLAAMEHWLDTGTAPDASFFPPAAGFVPGFIPPLWPY